jgi:tripartite-type tricarboxylate transporter receptor subunit TctC
MEVRKLLTLAALAGALGVLGGAGVAQTGYPSAPIRVIIPLAPGGANDVMVRALGKAFEQRNGHGFIVESRAGANTIIAANACKAAPPDGATICLLSRSSVSLNPNLYRNLSYDPLKDFEPITNLAFAHQVLILNKNVPVKDFGELVTYSKQHPDKVNFGSFGVGGDTHLVVELLKHETGAKMTHIPYKGASDAMLAFKSGDIQLLYLIVGNPDIARQINEGEVKGLLVPGSRRNPLVPDVLVRRGRIVSRSVGVRDLVRHVRAEGNAGGDRQEAQRGIRRHREDAGFRETVPDLEGLHARGQRQRRVCQVHRRGSGQGKAPRRHFRREARAMIERHGGTDRSRPWG